MEEFQKGLISTSFFS